MTSLSGHLQRYRVMAIITGTLLVIVFLGMLRYLPGVEVGDGLEAALGLVAQVHGIVYMVYLVATYLLWNAAKWRYPRLLTMALGGVIPGLSFVMERKVTREVAGSVNA